MPYTKICLTQKYVLTGKFFHVLVSITQCRAVAAYSTLSGIAFHYTQKKDSTAVVKDLDSQIWRGSHLFSFFWEEVIFLDKMANLKNLQRKEVFLSILGWRYREATLTNNDTLYQSANRVCPEKYFR